MIDTKHFKSKKKNTRKFDIVGQKDLYQLSKLA